MRFFFVDPPNRMGGEVLVYSANRISDITALVAKYRTFRYSDGTVAVRDIGPSIICPFR